MKIESTWTSILRQIDVTMQEKNIVYRNIILERLCVPSIKIKYKHTFMFLAKLFEAC